MRHRFGRDRISLQNSVANAAIEDDRRQLNEFVYARVART